MQAAPALRDCPSCGSSCPAVAEICFECKKVLPPAALVRFEEAELAALRQRLAAGGLPATPAKLPGKFRGSTWIKLLVSLGGIGLVATGNPPAATTGVFVILFGLGAFLLGLVVDLGMPSPAARKSPEEAVLAYFKGVQLKRWRGAWACLSPLTREREVAVPESALLKSAGRRLRLTGPDDVKSYWRHLAHNGGGGRRRLTEIRVNRLAVDAELARLVVALRFQVIQGRIGLAETPVLTAFEVVSHLQDGRWWLYGGELYLPDSRA